MGGRIYKVVYRTKTVGRRFSRAFGNLFFDAIQVVKVLFKIRRCPEKFLSKFLILACLISMAVLVYVYPSSANSKSYSITTKEDWEGGTLSNLITTDAPGDLKLASGGTLSHQAWQDPPNTVGSGAAASDGTDIYLLRGNYDINFYKYSSAKNTWSTLADAPVQVGQSSALTYDNSGHFYAFFGRNTRQFYKYTIATNSWTALGDLPDTVNIGSNMVFTNGKLYILRSNATTDFWSYTIETGAWATLKATPATFTTANGFVTDGTYIYACRGNTLWYRYNIASNIWEAMTTVLPISLAEQTDFVLRNGSIYFAAPSSATYYKCELSGLACTGNAWTTATTLPAATRYSNAVYNASDDYIYIFRGNSTYDFWKYRPGESKVAGPQIFPQNFTTGGDIVYGGGDTVYGLKGAAAANGFYSYSIASGTWTLKSVTGLPTLSNDAKTVKAGDKIYTSSAASTAFTAYDTTNDAAGWVAKAVSPGAFGAGTSFTYLGGDLIYAMRGAGTVSFYAYSISNNNWSTFDPADLPAGLAPSIGARTVTNGTEIFATMGNGSSKFYKYEAQSNTWEEKTQLPFGAYYGTDLTYYNGKIYAIDGNYRSGLYEYDISANSWRKLADLQTRTNLNNGMWSGSSIEYVGNNDLMITFGASNMVFFYDVDSNTFASSGSYESASIDLGNVSAWGSLTVAKTTPSGTSVVVETKTSADNTNWPENWTAVSGTTIGSDINRYVKIKITLNANGDRTLAPTVSSLTLNYNPDDVDPTNPQQGSFTGLSAEGGTAITSTTAYRHEHPYFSWSAGADADSYVEGYYVYFGSNQSADPQVDGVYQTATNYKVNDKIAVGNNYLLVKTKDQAGNITDSAVQGFIYNYIGATPATSTLSSDADFNAGDKTNLSVSSDSFALESKAGFWQQQKLSVFPATSAAGASIIKKGNKLYATRGSTNAFYSYDYDTDTWATLTSTNLGAMTTNGGLVDGPGNYIYAYRGSTSASFYRYDVTDDAAGWSDADADDVPAALGAGCNSTYDGSRYIYMFKGNSNVFYRFDPQGDSNGTWESMEPVNFGTNTANNTVADGGQLVHDGSGTIYAIQGGHYPGGFAKYTISSDTWTPLNFIPVGPSSGASMVWDSTTSKILLIPGYSREYLYSYNPANSSWTKLSDAPMTFTTGTSATISGDYMYVIKGNSTGFYRYRISKNSWEMPSFNLFGTNFQGGSSFASITGAFVLKGDGDNFYLNRGNLDTRFIRYNSRTGASNQMPSLPSASNQYSLQVYDDDRNDIYYYSTADSTFYKYDIDTESWEKIATDLLPQAPAAGSSFVYDGSTYIYYFRGGTVWYRYNITADAGSRWSTALPTTGMSTLGYGSDTVIKDGFVYANRGSVGNPNEFRKFDLSQLPSGSWSNLTSIPYPVGYDGFLEDGGNGKLYILAAHNTNRFYEYTIGTDSWAQVANFPGVAYQGSAGASDKLSKIFAISGNGTGSYADGLYSYVIQSATSSFKEEGNFISPSIELSGAYKFANLTLNYEEKNNTTVTVYTQTSANGASWSDWSQATNMKSYGLSELAHQYQINSPLARYIKIKVELVSGDGVLSPSISQIDINYYQDNTKPTNPQALSQAKSAKVSGSDITSGMDKWYNFPSAYFAMPESEAANGASDGANGSGVAGYYIYMGTSSDAVPSQSRGIANQVGEANLHYQTDLDLELSVDSSALETGKTYYLLTQSKDAAGNVAEAIKTLFIYRFDSTAPSAPASVNATQNDQKTQFNFTWPAQGAEGGAADVDPNDSDSLINPSGLAGYKYKTGAAWSSLITESTVSISNNQNLAGENTFHLIAIDNAGNESSEATVKFYIAPTQPQNLSALPVTSAQNPSETNNFKFVWEAPTSMNGSIKQYRYSVNAPPTALNTVNQVITGTTLGWGAYATQQGKNTLYIVAEGDWGGSNINYDAYATLDFYIETPAPNPPENLSVTDSSNRSSSDYRLTVVWSEPKTGEEPENYVVKRSTDNQSFSEVGTTSSTGFLDSDLEGDKTYYYKVFSKDSAGALSEDQGSNGTVSKKPTGKYSTPPTIAESSIHSVAGASTVEINWVTNRASDSFVEYGTTEALGQTYGQREEVTEHKVKIDGLKAGNKYYFKAQSLDPGDLRDYSQTVGYSEVHEFETTAAPTLSSVSFSNITTSSAIMSFDTNKTSTAKIQYGTSTEYGKEIVDSSGSGTTKHTVLLEDLQDGTTYQLKVTITDEENNIVDSPGHAFTTRAKPKIEAMNIEPIKDASDTSVKVTCVANVEVAFSVQYSPSTDSAKKEVATAEFKKVHEFTVNGLSDQSKYSFQAIARDQLGNEVKSEVKTFDTPNDSRPPAITDISTESSNVGLNKQDKAQIVVAWKTDEPTTSMIEYGEGMSGTDYSQKTKEDATMTNSHLVIISDLEPSQAYHIRISSTDKGGNNTKSEDISVVPGEVPKSVLQMLLNTFKDVFGWMGKLI